MCCSTPLLYAMVLWYLKKKKAAQTTVMLLDSISIGDALVEAVHFSSPGFVVSSIVCHLLLFLCLV